MSIKQLTFTTKYVMKLKNGNFRNDNGILHRVLAPFLPSIRHISHLSRLSGQYM